MDLISLLNGIVKVALISLSNASQAGRIIGYHEGYAQAKIDLEKEQLEETYRNS